MLRRSQTAQAGGFRRIMGMATVQSTHQALDEAYSICNAAASDLPNEAIENALDHKV